MIIHEQKATAARLETDGVVYALRESSDRAARKIESNASGSAGYGTFSLASAKNELPCTDAGQRSTADDANGASPGHETRSMLELLLQQSREDLWTNAP